MIYYTYVSLIFETNGLFHCFFLQIYLHFSILCETLLIRQLKYFVLIKRFVWHNVPFQVVSAGERRNSIAARAIEHRSDGRRAAGRGKVGMYLSKRLELRNRGRSGNVRETKRSKLEGRAQRTGTRRRWKTKRRGKGWCRCWLWRAKDGGSWLKRQYRRKLIIGLHCTREENKIQASSDCCFQLNPTLSTWMNVLVENNQAPPGATI